MFAEVILPVPLPEVFSYRIPDGMELEPGMRVEVPLGGRTTYNGTVLKIFREEPQVKKVRDITRKLDEYPLVGEDQLKFWSWLADYYMCTLGEVYRSAMPRGLKADYSPRMETFTGIIKLLQNDRSLNEIMDGLGRAPKQLIILQRLLDLLLEGGGLSSSVKKSTLMGGGEFSASAYTGLLRKKIIREHAERSPRLPGDGRKLLPPRLLTGEQSGALDRIHRLEEEKPVILLKGVTSSGKTEIYIHLISEVLKQGRQVLYLLPEIALTTQIIERLKNVFGDSVGIYHSKYSDAERVETFLRARENPLAGEYSIILGARSAVFLPFRDLGLVIIDEEHEHSYKQADPAPRYHARDAAIILAEISGARVLMGSATPSFESYYNARTGKYGLLELNERFGNMSQPKILLANLRESYRKKKMISHFTPELYNRMKLTLEDDRQVILFQNRRGFSPYIECFNCGWIPHCRNCDVSLVYHKHKNLLVCHYCGYSEKPPGECPECHETRLVTRGFGTEMVEEEVAGFFPEYRIDRMDLDTTRSRKKYERIIRSFESGSTHILIGTQIVTKGLDFDHVGLVGVLNADNLIAFPDFRSYERSYQLLAQVAGRSGRKNKEGTVIIQTSMPEHPVFQQLLHGSYHKAYMNQMKDRQAFHYPPYFRLMKIILRHSDRELLDRAAKELALSLRKAFQSFAKRDGTQTGKGVKLTPEIKSTDEVISTDEVGSIEGGINPAPEVLGPQSPVVGRVQNIHISTILLKLPRTEEMPNLKELAGSLISEFRASKNYRNLYIIPDVDPY